MLDAGRTLTEARRDERDEHSTTAGTSVECIVKDHNRTKASATFDASSLCPNESGRLSGEEKTDRFLT